ncbi:MAG TPA: hypothetical protein VFS37_04330 [Conexibacter sp.]|nr:hypothetical protein [Conexibacter sp.]
MARGTTAKEARRAPARAVTSGSAAGPTRAPTAAEVAWLAVLPAALIAVTALVLLGPPLGHALLEPEGARFWADRQVGVHPEPVEHARYLIAIAAPLLLSWLTARALRRNPRLPARTAEGLALAVQVLGVGFVVLCVLAQEQVLGPLYRDAELRPLLYRYFTTPTLAVAAVATAALVLLLRNARAQATLARWGRETPARTVAAILVATVGVVVWLSHALYTEATIGFAFRDVVYHVQFPMDETFAVLDGRTPLVDFAAQYGSLWPYAYAAAMSLLGSSASVWLALAVATTGLGMLAIYAVLRRTAHSALYGLILFMPVLAASFYRVGGTLDVRYTYATYYGTFPLRYAGPSLLAWLVARHLAGQRPQARLLLFAAAGIVALNNADAGLAAVGATAAALLWADGRPTRSGLIRVGVSAAGGLAAAYALVSVLTLLRAGALPDLSLLLRFSRLFASAGFAMVPMPTLGLHVVVFLTFAAAIGVATVRALNAEAHRLLTGMLAWSGVFGLGAGGYFVGRSTPENLIAVFFPWAFALALLTIPAVGSLRRARPSPAALACVFGFAVLGCTLAQTPLPWRQLDRLQHHTAPIFAQPWGQTFIAQHTRPGERAAILVLLGHRIGANLGVVNVSPYSAMASMPTVEQLEETIAALRAAGGRKLFLVAETTAEDVELALTDAGFVLEQQDPQTSTTFWIDTRGGPRP